ncbi:MAG: hypothetical protein HZA61_15535 [Candidatus Eisenbacteria bacterium]|uniref:Alginate export domain-containing protein n=1 Tax=Eiseniibacteriota bacterium TaxID=2212470 RepID=A0A933SGI0_UNCEI|nr:hypothetical protein [Candidatus Eisenbacteria bacterium]
MHQGTKRILAAALFALALPAIAAASSARMSGLAIPGDYVKGEQTGMFTYLSEVNSAGNLAYVEAASTYIGFRDHAVGAVLPGLFDGKYGVWSFHLRQTAPSFGGSWLGQPIQPGYSGHELNFTGEAFDVIWGHKMGSGNLALRLNRSFESYDDGATTEEGHGNRGRNVFGFGAGYGWDMNANLQVELAGQMQKRDFDSGDVEKSDGGNDMLLAARAFHKASGNLVLIPALKYFRVDQSYLDTEGDAQTEEWSGLQAGIAGNWTVGSGDLLVFGAQFVRNNVDYGNDEFETERFMPNVFLALETHVNPWLSFRAGAQNAFLHTWDNKFSNVERHWKDHYFGFSMGTSVKLGSLMLDATLDPAFLQNPFAQLMGGSSAFFAGGSFGGPERPAAPGYYVAFPQVSATYTW